MIIITSLGVSMATREKDLKGWQIIKRDDQGNVIDEASISRRRTRRGTTKESVAIKCESDGVEFTRGDHVLLKNDEDDALSLYLINEIRLNTLSNAVEIWAFVYLRRDELDPYLYFKKSDEKLAETLSESDLEARFNQEVSNDEVFLTAEMAEILLRDFVKKVTVSSSVAEKDTLLVRYACEPNGTNFTEINITDEMHKFVNLEPKHAEQYLKSISLPSAKRKTSHINLMRQNDNKNANTHRYDNNTKVKVEDQSFSLSDSENESLNKSDEDFEISSKSNTGYKGLRSKMNQARYEKDSGTNKRQNSHDQNETPRHKRQKTPNQKHSTADREASEKSISDKSKSPYSDSEEIDYSSQTETESDSISGDSVNDIDRNDYEEIEDLSDPQPEKIKRPRGRPRNRTISSKKNSSVSDNSKSRKMRENSLQYAVRYNSKNKMARKFSKKNVARAKKKYTPFSKRYTRISDIPDLSIITEEVNSIVNDDLKLLETGLYSENRQVVAETIFSKVKKQLYSSHGKEELIKSSNLGEYLPARENEFASIYLTMYSAIESDSATTIYVAGTPGVGKTLTVREVIKELQNSMKLNELNKFQYIEINGLKMVKPTDSYEMLWNRISGEQLTWGAAMESLEFYFNKVPKNKKATLVLLLDELDALVNKSQDIMYNFFNWTTYENAKLIVVTIANAMDLPERELGNKVSSRIGFTRIMFSGYTHDELKTIIGHRLRGLNDTYFYVNTKTGSARLIEKPEEDKYNTEGKSLPSGIKKVRLQMSTDAIEIAARKVASVSGDARRALKICKRATEIAESQYMKQNGYDYDIEEIDDQMNENIVNDVPSNVSETMKETEETQTVQISHVMKALNETINSQVINFVSRLPFTCKLFLFALLNLMKKTNTDEHVLSDVSDEIKLLLEVNGNDKMMSKLTNNLYGGSTEFSVRQLRMISWDFTIMQLVENGIIVRQNLKNERIASVKINFSIEDIRAALEKDEILKGL